MFDRLQPLPPSDRDFDLYRRTKIERDAPQEVAAEWGVSREELERGVQRVADFLMEAALAKEDQRHDERVFTAEQLAAERIDFLYGEAMRAFRRSQGMKQVTREIVSGPNAGAKSTTTRESVGDARYLAAAACLAKVGSKLAFSTLRLYAPPESAMSPPVRDCSARGSKRVEMATPAAERCDASGLRESSCDHDEHGAEEARREFFAPVHSDEPATEVFTFGAEANGSRLTRKERRARQKLLEQKLRNAR